MKVKMSYIIYSPHPSMYLYHCTVSTPSMYVVSTPSMYCIVSTPFHVSVPLLSGGGENKTQNLARVIENVGKLYYTTRG